MKSKMFLSATILAMVSTSVYGTDTMDTAQARDNSCGDLYRPSELSVDAFGTASVGQYTIDHLSGSRVHHNTRLGLGVGANYFITRYIGLGVDAYSENSTGSFFDSLQANVIGRLPLGHCGFAPYVFGGGGYQFDLAKVSFGQCGGGVEYRFCKNVGVFTDARWVIPEHTQNFGVGRRGIRYAF